MTVHLLDANVLIALIDPLHIFHDSASRWFGENRVRGWATCPLTQNAILRIVGTPSYRNYPGHFDAVARLLRAMTALPVHEFWADDLSLLDPARFDTARLRTSAQITDAYLLALAVAHGGKLATFDRRLVADAVAGGANAVHRIAAN